MKPQSNTELIDRYVAAVGRELPRRERADVEAELRSLLLDRLEDRSAGLQEPAGDELIVEILREMGSPEQVATQYGASHYLIGPRFYPAFIRVASIVLVVQVAVNLIGLIVAAGRSEAGLGEVLAGAWNSFAASAFGSLGIVVLVFTALERTVEARPALKPAPWDPRKLPAASEVMPISFTGRIIEIVITVLALVLFNYYPELIGVGFARDGRWTFIPVLTSAFAAYLPLLNVRWVLGVAVNVLLIWQGRQLRWHRWLLLGLKVMDVAILAAMIAGPALVIAPAQILPALEGLPVQFDLLLGLLVVITLIDIVKLGAPLLRPALTLSYSIDRSDAGESR